MATKKFRCKVCGYVHEGDKAPATCPVCQAPASEFEEVKDNAKKGLDRDSNVYTIVYAAVMVVLVAVVLAFTSQSLRSYQKKNEDNDKRQQILRSINVSVKANEAEAKYNELIKEALEEIERMKLEIMELRGTKTCPKCGAELADGAEFCSACGEKVSVVVDTDPEAEDVTVEEVSEEEKKEEL